MLVEGVHRDRHDAGGRRVLEQRAYGMQGVSGSGGASVGGMRMRTKVFVPCLA